ncbi:hypothetical protein ISS30_05475, partial [bacterium]|nr:hypothetical protein [bacterium]
MRRRRTTKHENRVYLGDRIPAFAGMTTFPLVPTLPRGNAYYRTVYRSLFTVNCKLSAVNFFKVIISKLTKKNTYPFFQLFIIFLLISAVIAVFDYPALDLTAGGDRARMATSEALVEHGAFAIDQSVWLNTLDKVYINGHFYGSQPPFLPILMAVVYFVIFHITGLSFSNNPSLLYILMTILFTGTSVSITAVILGKISFIHDNDRKRAFYFAVLFFFSTLFLTHVAIFNNHTIGGLLILLAYYLVFYKSQNEKQLFLTGLICSAAAMIDPPPGAAMGFVLFIYIIVKFRSLKSIYLFILGTLPPVVLYSISNYIISGSIVPVTVNPQFFDYPSSAFNESNLSGVAANTNFREIAVYAFHCLIGHRGWFSYTPLLIFGIWGCIRAFKGERSRAQAWITITVILMVMFFYIWRSINYGGHSYGVRFFLGITPILFMMIIYTDDIIRRKPYKLLFRLAAVWSIIIAVIGLIKPVSDPKISLNSAAVNLYILQIQKLPQLSDFSWKVMNFINAGDADKAVALGKKYLLMCQVSPAEKAFSFALEKKESSEAYHGMSKTAEYKRDNEKALQYARKAYNMNPLPKYYLQIERMLFSEGYIDSANYYLEKYIEYGDSINLEYPEILLRRGLGFFGKYTRDRTIAKIADNMIALGLLDSAEYYLDRVSGTGQDLAEINLVRAHYHFARGDTFS